ncbi:hypothetical protein DPMN_136740 [Dreissena polymorpha]|uniref:Uncharacterized protein n=1 Tax=Dreissena polymorpha TaxID=45954 RepID=A0A9D4JI54_DREPO|nr:hypothetical protein DPMN_136740 [Dreissena polymorpha]
MSCTRRAPCCTSDERLRRWAGVNVSGCHSSPEVTYVRGLSLIKASVSVTIVCSVCSVSYVTYALPSTFFNTFLLRLIILSYQPPNQGALLGMNFHSINRLLNSSRTTADSHTLFKYLAAAVNAVPLSDIIMFGVDLRLQKRLNANRNDSADRSGTSS